MLLISVKQEALHHHAEDRLIAGRDLVGEGLCNPWLIFVILPTIRVAAIHHNTIGQFRFA